VVVGKEFPISALSFLKALFVSCCLNGIFPYRLGEFGRVIFLKIKENLDPGIGLANLATERGLDVFTLSCICLGVIIPFMDVAWMKENQVYLLAFFLLSVFFLLLGRWWYLSKFPAVSRRLGIPSSELHGNLPWLHSIARGFQALANPKNLLNIVFLSFFAVILESCSYFFLLKSLALNCSFALAMLLFIAIAFASLLPSAPGSLGILQFAAVYVLEKGGVGQNDAINFTLFLTAMLYLPVFGGILVFLADGFQPLVQAWYGFISEGTSSPSSSQVTEKLSAALSGDSPPKAPPDGNK